MHNSHKLRVCVEGDGREGLYFLSLQSSAQRNSSQRPRSLKEPHMPFLHNFGKNESVLDLILYNFPSSIMQKFTVPVRE